MSKNDEAVAGPSTAKDPSSQTSTSDMEEHMVCSICCELIHDCVGLQPCMHCFCGGCFSKWLEKSNDCPQCRKDVDRVGPNHMVRNLIEAYLKTHPGKRRSVDEIELLDAANKIEGTMDLVGGVLKQTQEEEGTGVDSEEDDDDEHSYSYEDSFESSGSTELYDYGNWSEPKRRRRGERNAIVTTCRQCPGWTYPPRQTDPEGSAAAYTCKAIDPPHLTCTCCVENMPDRRHHRLRDPTIPQQQCEVCQSQVFYCHQYFGRCSNFEQCHGCLISLADYHFTDAKLSKVLLHNEFESNVLKVYMEGRSLTWPDIQRDCLAKLDSGVYKLSTNDVRPFGQSTTAVRPLGLNVRFNSTIISCGSCALALWSQLAYQYRRDIDPADLPANVTQREDCYWGKNCRTQIKLHHASRLNHICEQTRRQ